MVPIRRNKTCHLIHLFRNFIDMMFVYKRNMLKIDFYNSIWQFLIGNDGLWVAFQEFAKDPSDRLNQNLVIEKANLFISRSQEVLFRVKPAASEQITCIIGILVIIRRFTEISM